MSSDTGRNTRLSAANSSMSATRRHRCKPAGYLSNIARQYWRMIHPQYRVSSRWEGDATRIGVDGRGRENVRTTCHSVSRSRTRTSPNVFSTVPARWRLRLALCQPMTAPQSRLTSSLVPPLLQKTMDWPNVIVCTLTVMCIVLYCNLLNKYVSTFITRYFLVYCSFAPVAGVNTPTSVV